MITPLVCLQCRDGKEYDTVLQLQNHIRETHIQRRRQDVGVGPSKAKEIEAATKNIAIKETVVKPQETAPIQPQPKAPEPPKRKPIVLEYHYTGQCPVCGVDVDTLPMEVGGSLYMVAWCTACRKKRSDIKVKPISQMQKEWLDEQEALLDDIKIPHFPINKFKKN